MASDHHYPLDLNEDQSHQPLFCSLRSSSSSSSSLSYLPFFNPPQEHGGYYNYHGDYHFQQIQHQEQVKLFVPNGGLCDQTTQKSETRLKLTIRKKGERNDQNQVSESSSSIIKWMPSRMRMIKKMMNNPINNSKQSFEGDQKQGSSSPSPDHSSGANIYNSNTSSSSNNNDNVVVRVCSDCNTTKTPLWRSGPRGPKSLCNACGIRQRKARRAAMAAAAVAAGGGSAVENAQPLALKKTTKKVASRHNKRSSEHAGFATQQVKKRCKITLRTPAPADHNNEPSKKLCFDDLTIILSKSSAFTQQAFPQDEKEAAILLMALSHGMVHG